MRGALCISVGATIAKGIINLVPLIAAAGGI